jgi:hypothetical protein
MLRNYPLPPRPKRRRAYSAHELAVPLTWPHSVFSCADIVAVSRHATMRPRNKRNRKTSHVMAALAEVWIALLPTEQGGRASPICLAAVSPGSYCPHLRVRGGNGELLGVEFIDGPDVPLPPGSGAYATVRFLYEPRVSYEALGVRVEFEVVEGSRVVGLGRITRLWPKPTVQAR